MFLALREIRRSKARFALLVVAVGLLVFLVLFQDGLKNGLITQFIGALRNQSAPVLVYGDQARTNLEGSQITPDQLAAIAEVPEVGAVGRLGEGTFTVSTPVSREEPEPADRLVDAAIFGYDLTGPGAGLGAPTTLIEGRLPEGPGEAVASERNADEGFDIGDVVRVEPEGLEITVVGLAEDINFSVSPTLFVGWDTYEAARRVRNPDATAVYPSVAAVEPADGLSPQAAVEAIGAAVEGVEPLTRQQAVDGSPGVESVSTSLDTVIYLLLLTALLVIALFVLIITVQKAAALTLLRAIGAKRATLVRSLLAQTALVVGAGIVLGVGLLAVVAPGASSIGVELVPGTILSFAVVVLVLGLVAALFSVWRVLRIDPIEATTGQGVLR